MEANQDEQVQNMTTGHVLDAANGQAQDVTNGPTSDKDTGKPKEKWQKKYEQMEAK